MIIEKEFEDFIFITALENAHKFGGKTQFKTLMGKAILKFPEMKEDMEFFKNKIDIILNQVNQMSLKDIEKKILEINPQFFVKTEKSKEKIENNSLPPLPNLPAKMITRFAPAPSGHLHFGHIYNVVYNYEYAKQYDGKFILRLEDTNPENIELSNYNQIIDDIKWLTDDGIDELFYQSDRIDIYYKYLRQLIETGYAYVCECEAEYFKNLNDSSKPCPHRNDEPNVQIQKYENFFNGKYKDGDAAIRFKGNLDDKNPALRDFPLARMVSKPHVRTKDKYKLWPMYNLCVSVDDALMGITYIIRGKDHEINGIRQNMIKSALNLRKAEFFHIGRIKFTDIELSKTKLTEKIKNNEYQGWDDPRIPTVLSLKKKGYKALAIRKMIIAHGISKRDSKISEKEYFKQLDFFNKQILEKESNRYFCVINPKLVNIENIGEYPVKEILLPKHPDFKDKGFRKFELSKKYYISSIDFNNIKQGQNIRLMHFGNFNVKNINKDTIDLSFLSKEYDKNLKIENIIHFVPTEKNCEIEIILNNNQKIKAIAEDLKNIKEDSTVQFERFGFARLDSKQNNKFVFYFTHR